MALTDMPPTRQVLVPTAFYLTWQLIYFIVVQVQVLSVHKSFVYNLTFIDRHSHIGCLLP